MLQKTLNFIYLSILQHQLNTVYIMKKGILLFIFLLTLTTFHGQTKLSLDDCIAIGFDNNLSLKNRTLDIQKQQLINKKAFWNNFPRVNFGASKDYEYGFNIEPSTNTRINEDFGSNDFGLNASVDIFNLAKLKEHKKTKIDLYKSVVDFEADRNIMLITIAQYYLEVMFNTEFVEILNKQVLESENQLKRLNEALSYGYIAKSELYDAEAEFAVDKKAVLIANNNKDKSIRNLFNLINYDEDIHNVEFFDVKFRIDTSPINDKNKYVSKALENNALALSSKYSVESAQKNVEVFRAAYYPTLRLRYQLESFYTKSLSNPDEVVPTFEDQVRDNKTHFVGASINVPIFNGFQNRYDVKIAKVDYEKAKIEQEIVENNLRFEVEQTIQDLENAISTYTTSLQVLNAAQESYRISRLKYEQGKINAFNYATAKENLLKAEIDLLDSKYKIYYNKTKLNIITKK